MDWNVLIDKLIKQFPKLLFLTVASAQEHVPFWSDGGIQYTPRHINIERLKLVNIYSNHYKNKGYSLYIQSNQFSRKYQFLDALVYEYRNQRWGREFPFGPYKVDKMNDHIAYSIKLGMIYKNHLL
ncbi:MAG: hypothetical protein HQK93_01730 [Nitrospirae bacterium]|nr:hypothetical protein [Nitrospirota bacterium]